MAENHDPNVAGDHPVELSVLVPVYNEERTVEELIRRVLATPYSKQIIVVDDGSTDGTAGKLETFRGAENIELISHSRNRGKGAAIRTALARARGKFTIIQDADLEYDPDDYHLLLDVLREGAVKVAYGSRYLSGRNDMPITKFWVGVKVLNLMIRVLYRARITDEATCYKAFDTDLLRSLNLRCERFEFCPEVTARLLKQGFTIVEVPIRYSYRTAAEGKKIGWWDGFSAVCTLLRFRLMP